MSSSQVGKSEVVGNTVGYHVDQDPAPIMVVMPTERDAETWSKDRFSPMARDTPCLAGKISDPKSRDGSNKILHKRFPGGHLTIVGANAPSGLASRPIRLLLCDEVDRYPPARAPRATRSTWRASARSPSGTARSCWSRRRRCAARAASRRPMPRSDQRRYWVPCPDCGAEQVLVWDQVRWEKAPTARTGPRRRAITAAPATPPGRTRCAGRRCARGVARGGTLRPASPAST